MHDSDAITILNCALDSLDFLRRVQKLLSEIKSLANIGCESEHVIFSVALLGLKPSAFDGKCFVYGH